MPAAVYFELWHVFTTLIFYAAVLAMFAVGVRVVDRASPFSITKEIEEDQNIALACLFGGIMIGLAKICAAALGA